MKLKNIAILVFALVFFVPFASAQKTEITISFNEQFFDSLLDAIYRNGPPIEFPLARNEVNRRDAETQRNVFGSSRYSQDQRPNSLNSSSFGGAPRSVSASQRVGGENPVCRETIQLLRENNGVRTAVRFREGKIYAPLAFSGNYNPPFIGCVPFSGVAETNIELEFDQNNQRLTARANVQNVSLSGTGGVGGSVIARLIQSSIDKKVNPIEIIRMDKLSFVIPIQNSGGLKMKAVGMRHEIRNGALNVHVAFEFLKA